MDLVGIWCVIWWGQLFALVKGDFLLKQGGETIALRANTHDLDTLHAVFANDSKNLTAALTQETG